MHLFAKILLLLSFLKSAFSAFWPDKSYYESMRHRPVSVSWPLVQSCNAQDLNIGGGGIK